MSNIVSVAGNGAAERCAIGDYLLAISHRSVDAAWHREELTFDVIDNRFALMFAISAVPEYLFCNVGHGFSVVRPLTNLLEYHFLSPCVLILCFMPSYTPPKHPHNHITNYTTHLMTSENRQHGGNTGNR